MKKASWNTWRTCVRSRVSARRNGKEYRTVVRPVKLHGLETELGG